MSNLTVIANNAHEMAAAQSQIAEWAETKARDARAHETEMTEALEKARKNGWGTTALVNAARLAKKHREFYHKIAAAVRLGYVVVPTFPLDVFAIRTKRTSPLPKLTTHRWGLHGQSSESLPSGEGRYVSATPNVVQEYSVVKNSKGEDVKREEFWADSFRDVVLPFEAVKPRVMDDVSRAMAANLFDEVGITAKATRADPMVIGQVIFRKGSVDHRVSFLISWWLDSSDLQIPGRRLS